jgi:ABC-type proline/glycine betaine transport system permease subunit
MILKCLKDKNPAFILGIGQILMFFSILLLASMYFKSGFGIEVHSPVPFLSDNFVKGILTGLSGVMIGISVVFNIKGMIELKKRKHTKNQ